MIFLRRPLVRDRVRGPVHREQHRDERAVCHGRLLHSRHHHVRTLPQVEPQICETYTISPRGGVVDPYLNDKIFPKIPPYPSA